MSRKKKSKKLSKPNEPSEEILEPRELCEKILKPSKKLRKLQPCLSCGSRPRLHRKFFTKLCAQCVALKLKNDQQPSSQDEEDFENELLRLNPQLIDLPLNSTEIVYLIIIYNGMKRGKPQSRKGGAKISRVELDFVIDKFSALVLLHQRNGAWYCCLNRVKALHYETYQRIIARGLETEFRRKNVISR